MTSAVPVVLGPGGSLRQFRYAVPPYELSARRSMMVGPLAEEEAHELMQ